MKPASSHSTGRSQKLWRLLDLCLRPGPDVPLHYLRPVLGVSYGPPFTIYSLRQLWESPRRNLFTVDELVMSQVSKVLISRSAIELRLPLRKMKMKTLKKIKIQIMKSKLICFSFMLSLFKLILDNYKNLSILVLSYG